MLKLTRSQRIMDRAKGVYPRMWDHQGGDRAACCPEVRLDKTGDAFSLAPLVATSQHLKNIKSCNHGRRDSDWLLLLT